VAAVDPALVEAAAQSSDVGRLAGSMRGLRLLEEPPTRTTPVLAERSLREAAISGHRHGGYCYCSRKPSAGRRWAA